MSIGDSLTLVSCLAGLMVALPGLMIVLNMTFSRTTERAVARLSRGAITPFVVGLALVIAVGYVAIGLMSMGSIFQFFGALLMLLLLCWVFTGMGVVARLIGLKLGKLAMNSDTSLNKPVAEVVLGAVVLTLAIAFPLVGWFVLLPVSWVVGTGGIVLGFFERRATSDASRMTPDLQRFTPEHV